MTAYQLLLEKLSRSRRCWLVTGAAGFIGSNLVEKLLQLDQDVVGIDNLATGHERNLDEIKASVSDTQWGRFRFVKGDIGDLADCRNVCEGVDYVLHQAALGSVPRSLEDPIATNTANIGGFLNVLVAARDARVCNMVYAASSSTYGDEPSLPKIEHRIGKPLSPYAVTKYVNELYAEVFARNYAFPTIGLRYFNVFGKRQDPEGAYAAVIPKWIAALLTNEQVFINGDGETSRDFCYVENAVQANLLAAVAESPESRGQVYNVAVGSRTTLNQLFARLCALVQESGTDCHGMPVYRAFRPGDVRHSQADISKARHLLGYAPEFDVFEGLTQAMPWYLRFLRGSSVTQNCQSQTNGIATPARQ